MARIGVLWLVPARRKLAPIAAIALLGVGCSSTPTAPSAPATNRVSAAVMADPRYDAAFFASFATGTRPKSLTVFVADVDDKKQPVPAATVAAAKDAAATLQAALGLPVDVRPLTSGADMFTGLTIQWLDSDQLVANAGGYALPQLPGAAFIYYRASSFEVCGGLAATVVRHELLHAMGFAHTDDTGEVMYRELRYCDILPSPREQFHARIALGLAP